MQVNYGKFNKNKLINYAKMSVAIVRIIYYEDHTKILIIH